MNLSDKITSLIYLHGAIPLDHYMALCISHYYNTRDPFGKGGDFITAPEISQMFGEIIGIWCINAWLNLGKPKFNLVEIGPGRGTLMEDLIRGVKHIKEFGENINKIYMLEASQALKRIQSQKLTKYAYNFSWVEHIDEVEKGLSIIINNEFFDALPIKQFIKTRTGFRELLVTIKDDKFLIVPLGKELDLNFECQEGSIIELSPLRDAYANKVATHIDNYGGAGLIIDYGYLDKPFKSTVQALKANSYSYIFDNIGEADITSLVDFGALQAIFEEKHLKSLYSTQGEFLRNYGIELRAEQLIENGADKFKIRSELDRLTAKDQMGELFKVLEVVS